MSAFVVCLNKKNHTICSDVFDPMHQALLGYAIDQQHAFIDHNVALSYHSFWTTPEEHGEIQPLSCDDGYYFVWDGRIDNRDEIYALLHDDEFKLSELSDAQLFLRFYKAYGINKLAAIVGPFAWVLFDRKQQVLHAARDGMGARYLAYAENDEWLCIGSTVQAITAHFAFEFSLNERLIAQQFSFVCGSEDSTFSSNVKLLLPGHFVAFESMKNANTSLLQCQYWLPDPQGRIVYRDARQYDEHFRDIFFESVSARLRTNTDVASMLSGGLDSAPMTLVAAEKLAANRSIHAVTWTFDELSACDERHYLGEIYDKPNIKPVSVNCDDAFPLSEQDDWPVNPDQPFDVPYRGKHLRAYHAIKQKGCRVTLSGMAGDDLYYGTDLIFYEYLRNGRLLAGLSELKRRFAHADSTAVFLKKHLFWYTKMWLVLKGRSVFQPPYITERAYTLMQGDRSFVNSLADQALRPKQYEQLVGTYWSNPLSTEKFFSTPYHTEVRYPFRDRRLVEFMLQIPSEHLYSNNITRPIIRRALGDLLPTDIKKRRFKTSFHPLLDSLTTSSYLQNAGSDTSEKWSYYVKFNFLRQNMAKNTNNLMILWQSMYWDYWVRQREKQ